MTAPGTPSRTRVLTELRNAGVAGPAKNLLAGSGVNTNNYYDSSPWQTVQFSVGKLDTSASMLPR